MGLRKVVVVGVPECPLPNWPGCSHPTHRVREQGNALVLSTGVPHPPQKAAQAPGKVKSMGAVQDMWDPQKSIIWINCLQRTHALSQASGFSPGKFSFCIYYFQGLASDSGSRHHCRQISSTCLGPRTIMADVAGRGSCPGKTAESVLDTPHVYTYWIGALVLSQCPPTLPAIFG